MAPRSIPQNALPNITVTRSSAEIPRPTTQSSAPQPDHHESLAQWLNQFGIPVHPGRLTKARARFLMGFSKGKEKSDSNTSRSITASNVSALEMEQFFSWKFISKLPTDNETHISGESAILGALATIGIQSSESDRNLFSLPTEWKGLELTLNASMEVNNDELWRSMVLRVILIYDPNHTYINFKSEKEIRESKFPVPNIFNLHNPQYTTGGIGWTLMNLLTAPTYVVNISVGSEMVVERFNGSLLTGFFNIPECETSSNKEVKFLQEVSCFGSFGRPDYATRVLVERLSQINDPELCPVVFLGEGKKVLPQPSTSGIDPTLLSAEHTRKRDEYTTQLPREDSLLAKSPIVAQMAFSAHSTLVLIIASLVNKWMTTLTPNQKPKREDYQIPAYALIYGVAYGSDGILIYGFFPHITERHKNGFPKRWGFTSVLVSPEFSRIFEGQPSFLERARFIQILLVLQQHAVRLKDEMKGLELPSVFHIPT